MSLPTPLIAPVGFTLIVTICAFFTSIAAVAPGAGAVVAGMAVAGFALKARTGRLRTPASNNGSRLRPLLWPGLAALGAFASVGGPVFLTGTPTWTGYTRIVDIAFQMDFAKHLADAGRLTPSLDSSYHAMINKLTASGYPGGGQAALGTMAGLVHADVPWCYQAYLAFAAAMGALAIFALLSRITTSRLLCAVGGLVAIQPNLLYGYSLEGGIKELTTAALLMVVVALLSEQLPGYGHRRSMLPLAVSISALFSAFSFGIAPWLGVVFAGLLFVTLLKPSLTRRRVIGSWAWLVALVILLSIPSIVTAAELTSIAGRAVGGVVDLGLGNLAAPVPDWSSAGVWLTADYRFPLAHVTATHAFDVLAVLFAVIGIGLALRQHRWAVALLGLSAPIALYYWIAHTGPWLQFKAFTLTGALTLLLTFVGVAALRESDRLLTKWLGWTACAAVAGIVLYGNAVIYHNTSLAPAARYYDLAAIGEHFAGQGPLLMPEFDEYAEYFLRDEQETDLVNPAYDRFPLASGVHAPSGTTSFGWDLNQISPAFVQKFLLIVLPRSPVASRPPANYDLVVQTRYFDVWRRDRPADSLVAHFPLSNLPHERAQTHFCPSFVTDAHRAGPGARIAYAQASPTTITGLTLGPHPDYWRVAGPDTVIAYGAGRAEVSFTIPQAGLYGLWLQGSIGRPLTLYLDGRRLTSIGYEERYPDQFLRLGKTKLETGAHTLRVVRGSGSLHPGSGDPTTDTEGRTIGAVVFGLEDSLTDQVHVASARDAARICNAPVGYEWLEILKPGGAPPDALRATTA